MNTYLRFIQSLTHKKIKPSTLFSALPLTHNAITAAPTTHTATTTHTITFTSPKNNNKKTLRPRTFGVFIALFAGAFLFGGIAQANATPVTQLTVTGQCFVENKQYDGSKAATSGENPDGTSKDTYELSGVPDGKEVFIDSYSLEFSQKDRDDGISIRFAEFTLGGADAGEFTANKSRGDLAG